MSHAFVGWVGALASVACSATREPSTPRALHVGAFTWVETGDSARPSVSGDDGDGDVRAMVRFHVDDDGALRRYDYAPVSRSGDWADAITFQLDGAGRVTKAEREAATFATSCAPVVYIEESLVAKGDMLVPSSRTLRDTSRAVLADATCGESMPPLAPLPALIDSLVARELVPRNWRALVVRSRTAPRPPS